MHGRIKTGDVGGPGHSASDSSALGPSEDGQVVGPYRDAHDGLDARREALLRTRARLLRVERRTEQARAYLEALDRELSELGETLDAHANGRAGPHGDATHARSRRRRLATYVLTAGAVVAAFAVGGYALGQPGAGERTATRVEASRARRSAQRAAARVEAMEARVGRLESGIQGTAASRQPPPAPGVSPPPADGDGVRQTSATTWEVDLELIDRALAAAPASRTPRFIPHEQDGRTVGVKIYGIRRESVLARLGIQNGDMIRTVNGRELVTPETALEAYARLRETDAVFLELVRRGQPRVHAYRLVP